jgi:hypothetical protein
VLTGSSFSGCKAAKAWSLRCIQNTSHRPIYPSRFRGSQMFQDSTRVSGYSCIYRRVAPNLTPPNVCSRTYDVAYKM